MSCCGIAGAELITARSRPTVIGKADLLIFPPVAHRLQLMLQRDRISRMVSLSGCDLHLCPMRCR